MNYSIERFDIFWRAVNKNVPFMNMLENLTSRQTEIALYEKILLSELPPVTLNKNITYTTIQQSIVEVYTNLEEAGLNYYSEFDTDYAGEYAGNFSLFLISGAEFSEEKPQNYKIAIAILYIMDAFVRGDDLEGFEQVVAAFDFEKYIGDITKLNEIEEFQSGYRENNQVLKGLDKIYLPDYILETGDYTHVNGSWYRTFDIEKAMTASGSVAQSLEKQDLEPGITSLNQTATERARVYLKKLKLRGRV